MDAGCREEKDGDGECLVVVGKGHALAAGGDCGECGLDQVTEGNIKRLGVTNPNVAGVDRTNAMIGKSAAYVAAEHGLQSTNSQSSDFSSLEGQISNLAKSMKETASKEVAIIFNDYAIRGIAPLITKEQERDKTNQKWVRGERRV